MMALPPPGPDEFPCGCLIVSGIHDEAGARIIRYANHYVHDRFGFPPEGLIDSPLASLLTRASAIIFDTYVLPTVLHEGNCNEILLELRTPTSNKSPVVLNARRHSANHTLIVLSLFDATQRNAFYQELVDTRRLLEEKATALRHLSATDGLTGLMNRRELVKRTKLMLSEACRNGGSVAMLVADIDYFKQLNDSLGHTFGDKILAELGARYRELMRATDIVARYGGEEFVFVASGIEKSRIQHFAQRLHTITSEVEVPGRTLTISVGISQSLNDQSFATLFARADKALYAAKAAGRNCSMFFEHDS